MSVTKITNIYRAGWRLGPKILLIYIRKGFGHSLNEQEFALISYFNLLLECNLTHVSEFHKGFVFKTAEGMLLYARVPPSSDFTVFRQIWKDEEYRTVTDAIRKYFKQETVKIVDAGANAGYSTIYLYNKLRRKFTPSFVCIEPGEENVRILKNNIGINRLSNVVVEQAGLFNKSCFLHVSTNFRDGKDWSLQVEESAVQTDLKAVEVIELMDKNGWDRIDFLKIDIEGAERYLFEDEYYARNFLERVVMISIEIHHEYGIGERILKILKENHFTCTETGEITLGINKTLVAQN